VTDASGPGETLPQIRHLIGGQPTDGLSGECFESRDPHDGALLATVARGSRQDGERAITAARTAFDDGPWPSMTAKERAAVLHRLADLVDQHADDLALLETRDSGKVIHLARHADLPRVAHNFRFFADYAEKLAHPDLEVRGHRERITYDPAGNVPPLVLISDVARPTSMRWRRRMFTSVAARVMSRVTGMT